MPIYEFFCPKCGKVFELRRLFSQADEPGMCPTCGSKGERLLSPFASKVDFYVRPSNKGAFRQLPAKDAKPRKSGKRQVSNKRKK